MGFAELGLGEKILKAIDEMGFKEPTPIQAKAIPVALMARDVLGLAQTGTGKTASFTLPMIEMLAGGRAKARMPRSLILTPTRELAAQIADNFDQFGKHHKLTKTLLTGGTSMNEQIKSLEQGVDVLIATPGRLLDLFNRGNIILADIKILVIDEADRMLDMGFIPDLEKIVSLIPPLRQTLFFSATMPKAITKLADQYLSNPKTIKVAATSKPAENVEQFLVHLKSSKEKNDALKELIQQENVQNAFIFCNRKRDIDGVVKDLSKMGYQVDSIHGDIEQKYRTKTLDAFKKGEVSLLVCSDVVARGIDISGVSHVFNYDVPINAEDYIHRIGRTGRAGKSGRAFMLVTSRDKKLLDNVEKLLKNPIKEIKLSGIEQPGKQENQKKSTSSKDTTKAPRKKREDNAANDSIPNKKVKGFGGDMPDFFKA